MKVLIVGAGIGGLTLAAYLQKYGIKPIVIEKAAQWKTIGYIIGLFPNGVRILDGINAAGQLKRKGAVIPEYCVKDGSGNTILEISFREWQQKYGPFIEVERDTLHRILRNLNKKTKIRMNTTIKSLQQTNAGVEVIFSNNKKEFFDVVVGADGINSQIRSFVQPEAKKDYSGFTFWALWAPKGLGFPTSINYYFGNGKLFAVFPTKNSKYVCALFALPAKHHKFDDSTKSAEFLRKRFCDMGGIVPEILNNLPENPSEIYHNDDNEVHLSNWYQGRVVLLGDSIHALSPILGMGASMAMEDAYVLAEELSNNDIDTALRNYESRRKPRVKFLQRKSRESHLILSIRSPLYFLRNIILKWGYGKHYYNILDKFISETP